MPVRTTVDIPEPLHDLLRRKAESSGASIRSLIVRAIEESYAASPRKDRLTGPLVRLSSKPGPRFPADENPHDLIFP